MIASRNQYSIIKRLLEDLDWNCEDQFHHHSSLSRIHWYPASFITAIPGNLIDIFSDEGDVVWDPFCGSGISAIESYRKGRRFYGNDICHIAIEITNAKINAIRYRDELNIHLQKLTEKLKSIDLERNFGSNMSQYIDIGRHIAAYEELKPWYSENVFEQLLILLGALEEELVSDFLKIICKVIFINIAKIACAQQKTWGHIADNVRPTATQRSERQYQVIPNYIVRAEQILERANRTHMVSNNGSVHAIIADSRIWSPPEPIDLVITSPPYPQMADYVTSQRLSYYWLGYDKEIIHNTKKDEIGARWQRHNSKKNDNYGKEIIKAFKNIISAIRPKGILAIMMPDFDSGDSRAKVINDVYDFLEINLTNFIKIRRHLNEHYRWAPFRKLKDEILSIWVKK